MKSSKGITIFFIFHGHNSFFSWPRTVTTSLVQIQKMVPHLKVPRESSEFYDLHKQFAKSRALHSFLLQYLACLSSYLPTRLRVFVSYVPTCLRAFFKCMLKCFCILRSYVPFYGFTCLYVLRTDVPSKLFTQSCVFEGQEPRTQFENVVSIQMLCNSDYRIINFHMPHQKLMNLISKQKSASNLLKMCIQIN